MKKLLLKLSALSLVVSPVFSLTVSCRKTPTEPTAKDTITFDQGDNVSILVGSVSQIKISNVDDLIKDDYRNLTIESSNSSIAKAEYTGASSTGVLSSSFSIPAYKEGTCSFKLKATNLSTQDICEGEITITTYSFNDTKVTTDFDSSSNQLDVKKSLKENNGKVIFGKISNWSKWEQHNVTTGFDVTLTDNKSNSIKSYKDANEARSFSSFFRNLTIDSNGNITGKLDSSVTGIANAGSVKLTISNSSVNLGQISTDIYFSDYTSSKIIKPVAEQITWNSEITSNSCTKEIASTVDGDDDDKIELDTLDGADLSMCSIEFASQSQFSDESSLEYSDGKLKVNLVFNDDVVVSFAGGSFTVNLLYYSNTGSDDLIQGSFTVTYDSYILSPYDNNNSLSKNTFDNKYDSTANEFNEYSQTYAQQTNVITNSDNSMIDDFSQKGYSFKDIGMCIF